MAYKRGFVPYALAAPFGVAVFVPLFANQITGRIASGEAASVAAVASIHFMAIAEILCVALGMVAVAFLPKRKAVRENKYASRRVRFLFL